MAKPRVRTRGSTARRRTPSSRAGARRGKTIFFPPKSKTWADIITIRSPTEARESVRRLRAWAGGDAVRLRKAIRSATLAANRALVSKRRRQRPLGPDERKQMTRVAEIYRRAAHGLSPRLAQKRKSA